MEPLPAAIITALILSPFVYGVGVWNSKIVKENQEKKEKTALFRSQVKAILSGERQPTVDELNDLIDKYLEFKKDITFGWKEVDNMNIDSLRHIRDKLLTR